jgi:hypothetical protein
MVARTNGMPCGLSWGQNDPQESGSHLRGHFPGILFQGRQQQRHTIKRQQGAQRGCGGRGQSGMEAGDPA